MYRKKSQNRLSMFLAIFAMLVIVVAIGVRSIMLQRQLDEYNDRKATLETQIADETKRTEEIEAYGKYTKTDEYVEEVARDKLGLVKDDEIIFKNEDAK